MKHIPTEAQQAAAAAFYEAWIAGMNPTANEKEWNANLDKALDAYRKEHGLNRSFYATVDCINHFNSHYAE